jgi:hypothetical protein
LLVSNRTRARGFVRGSLGSLCLYFVGSRRGVIFGCEASWLK